MPTGAMRAHTTTTGQRRHLVQLEMPGPRVPDPDGGYVETWVPCDPPEVWARIRPASARELDRLAAGTVVTTATHIVTILYHPQVTTETRVTYNGRVFTVIGPPVNPEESNRELDLICSELLDTGTPGRAA